MTQVDVDRIENDKILEKIKAKASDAKMTVDALLDLVVKADVSVIVSEPVVETIAEPVAEPIVNQTPVVDPVLDSELALLMPEAAVEVSSLPDEKSVIAEEVPVSE